MIVVDSSALLSIVLGEPDAETFVEALTGAHEVTVGSATLIEASIVTFARVGEDGARDLTQVLDSSGVRIVPLGEEHVAIAVKAWRRFGKGRHPAALDLGDCYAYAVAVAADAPLLYKGDDFPQTDVRAALRA